MPATDAPRQPASDKRRFVERVLIALLLTGLALLLVVLVDVLLLLFGAALVAVILKAIADPLAGRLGLDRRLALLLAVLVVLGVLGGAGLLFGTSIAEQVATLREQLPAAVQSVQQQLAGSDIGRAILQSAGGAANGGDLANQVFGYLPSLAGALTNLVLVFIAGVFLASEPRLYRHGLLELAPSDLQPPLARVTDASGEALRLWLLGQLLSMTLVGVATGVALALLGVPSPLALGLFAGLAQFIPFVGPIISAVPGVLVALTVSPDLALWTLAAYVVVQQIESNFITPLVMQRMVDLPPALTLFAVLGLGAIFGPLGIVLGGPLAVVLFVAVKHLYVRDTLGHETDIPGEAADRKVRAPA
jgi:predicted PurR-regulated permease PerM